VSLAKECEGGGDSDKAGIDGLGKVTTVAEAGETGENSDGADDKDSKSGNDVVKCDGDGREMQIMLFLTVLQQFDLSWMFTAFLVCLERLESSEVIVGGEGAGGGVWGTMEMLAAMMVASGQSV
jgi:hypothetical protein